jgi:hypothetical protein
MNKDVQNRPTAGEWTMESLDVITKGSKGPVEEWQRIVYAHNTALEAAIAEAVAKESLRSTKSSERLQQQISDMAAAQQPLVDALTKARKDLGCVSIDAIGRDIDAALAKVGQS